MATRADVNAFIGARVKKFRIAKSLTQADLARAVGMTRASIANIEAGRQKLSADKLYAVSAALSVGPEMLLPAVQRAMTGKVHSLRSDRDASRWLQSIAA